MSGILSPKPCLALFAACLSIHSLILRSSATAAEERPVGAVGAVAEIQPYEIAPAEAPSRAFERWRAQVPGTSARLLPLEMLAIPGREECSMVHVAGMLVAPLSGDYAFSIHAPEQHKFDPPDELELWILNDRTGEWNLAQCSGNPNKKSGRTRLEAGVPRRFELWTMGSRAIAVDWEVADFETKDPETGGATIRLARETIPSSALRPCLPAPDDRDGDGLRDSWKQRHGLDPDGSTGPEGPWGDPDGDGLLNWQEQLGGTDPLKADTEDRDGLVRWEIWRDIPGAYVFDLRRASVFPTGPREVRYLNRLEIPTGNGNHYGSRIRGFLKPPADGEYAFNIIADDSAELWLGESDSWQSKRLIAKAGQPGSARLTWTRRGAKGEILPLQAEQIAHVTLKAGRSYYLEILHKQDISQDHCAVAWVRPGTDTAELIGAEFLASWRPAADDSDDDGLPDEWQRSAGLSESTSDSTLRHAEADPDRDGAPNREEWLAGTDPLNAADVPESSGMLTSEAWSDIPGHRVAELTSDPRFPARPDFTTRIDNLDFDREGENYGVRLRGYLTAPDDGAYRFAISGNNACLLYLSESEDKFTKRVIALVEHGTNWRFFAAAPQQRGGPVELQAGRRYYIEVLFKRGSAEAGSTDHSSVAWTRPGRLESVIDPEFFSPYRPDPRDLDDDDLPDDWEILHGLDPADPAGIQSAWGDADADGLENFREFRLGLDPAAADVHGTPGLALWEYWDDREDLMPALRDEGGTLSERLRQDPRFPLVPVRREWRESLEAPRGVDVNYAARMRAVIVAPETGDYVFAVSSHHASELFLSPDESKFKRQSIASIAWASRYREWDNNASQTSAPVRLEAGAHYYIEAFHAQGRNPLRRDHLCVAWKLPGSESFEVIGSESLIAFFRDPNDVDDDDLPDDWERANGLPVDATSGDGDFDGDGLTDREEYQLGTRADRADSDGDGVNDLDEIRLYESDLLVKDAVPPVLHADLPLGGVLSAPGNWQVNSQGVLTSIALRSTASFVFAVELPGLYVVRLGARSVSIGGYAPPVQVAALVDGDEIGRGTADGRGVPLSWITGWLASGEHVVTIDNGNFKFAAGLEITSLKLLRIAGEDPGENGIPDWIEALLESRNKFKLANDKISQSEVSPACVEGTSRLPGGVSLRVGGAPIKVFPGIGQGWYADVPLTSSGETLVEGSFEGGSIESRLRLVWTALNPFETPERRQVRVGDSLKFAVPAPEDPELESGFTLAVDGAEIYADRAGPEVVVRFDQAGDHVIDVALSGAAGDETRQIVVVASTADFGPVFSVAAGAERVWNLPGISTGLSLDHDPRLEFTGTTELPPSGMRTTALWTGGRAAHSMVLARLREDGPIVAATRLNVFKLIDAAENGDAHIVEVLPDGTRVVEISYMIEGEIPADFSLWIDFYVTDAVFADGSTRYHLTAADFDEFGIARIKIYKAAGDGHAFVCHWNRLYEEDGDGDLETEEETPE